MCPKNGGLAKQNGDEPTDLLPLLNGKCFVIKDFTTTLSQREETVKKILGDLTSIYDDSFVKHSPARGTVRYTAFFSILGCVTPQAINRHQRYMNQIGPRFLFFRISESTEEELTLGLDIFWSMGDSKELFTEAQKKVSAYAYQLAENLPNISLEKESLEIQGYFNKLGKFIARARGLVITQSAQFTNSDKETITFYEPLEIQVEEPYRAIKQLYALSKSLAIVNGKTTVTHEELLLIRKVALSSMPADRAQLLSVIARKDAKWTAKEVSEETGISHRTALRQLDELVCLKVLSKEEQGLGLANTYSVRELFHSILYPIGEFVSNPTVTETPQREIQKLQSNTLFNEAAEIFSSDSYDSLRSPP